MVGDLGLCLANLQSYSLRRSSALWNAWITCKSIPYQAGRDWYVRGHTYNAVYSVLNSPPTSGRAPSWYVSYGILERFTGNESTLTFSPFVESLRLMVLRTAKPYVEILQHQNQNLSFILVMQGRESVPPSND
jgi:hypothetical protein